MPSLPTGTVTFLFSDVEGSTQLVQTTGAAYSGLLADVRRLLRAEIAQQGGIEVDATGDELSAVFEEAHPALRAALAGQERIRDFTWPEGIAVRVRMGLHTGVPQLGEEGYTGLDVIRASRITAAGHGGQILLSSTSAPFVSEFETRDLGTHRLQGRATQQAEAEAVVRIVGAVLAVVVRPVEARRMVDQAQSITARLAPDHRHVDPAECGGNLEVEPLAFFRRLYAAVGRQVNVDLVTQLSERARQRIHHVRQAAGLGKGLAL